MSKSIRLILATGIAAASLAVPTAAFADPDDNWGQEVKECNATNCYPGGTERGPYVSGEAKDSDRYGNGYSGEIHEKANPGKANPRPHRG
ncbi:hypothetical protein [Kocuria sp. U4B]